MCICYTGERRGGAKDTGSGILDNDNVVTLRTALKKARAAGGCEELIRTLDASGKDNWVVGDFKGSQALS